MSTILFDIVQADETARKTCLLLMLQYPRFTGLIVVQYEVSTLDTIAYWNGEQVVVFDEEHETAYPKRFKTHAAADKRVRKLNDQWDSAKYKAAKAFWLAPEVHEMGMDLRPIAKYILISSRKPLPGSPTQ